MTLGLGAGERLNEHVVGEGWPPPRIRREMLGEAIDVIRLLWRGGTRSFHGGFYALDQARLWDLPATPPPMAVAAGGPASARLAGEKHAGLFATAPDAGLVTAWERAGGEGARYAEVALAWAPDEAAGRRLAHERFRFGPLSWEVKTELATVSSFEAAARAIRPEDVAEEVPCGPDPARHVAAVRRYLDAGYDHVVLLGVGPDQAGFLRFWHEELRPRLHRL